MKAIIYTPQAPAPIGAYSQAVKAGAMVYLSGQIPLVPETMKVVEGDFEQQVKQIFNNIKTVAVAAGGSLNDIVKLTIYLTDLSNYSKLNDVLSLHWVDAFPARTVVEVSALPKNVSIEIDAIMITSL